MARKRKRGSCLHKRDKKSNGKRKFLIIAACCFGVLPALIPICYFWLLSWLQGDSFRSKLEETLSNKLKADITLPAPLQLDGDTVKLASVEWSSKDFLKKAEIKGINTRINRGELWDKCLHATQITVKEISAEMDTKKEQLKNYPEKEGGFFSNFTPDTYIADRIECGNTSATLTLRRSDPKKKPYRYSLKGSSMTATPIAGKKNAWHAGLRNGTLITSHSYLAKSSIRHAMLDYANDTVTLSECQLALTKGNMDATGSFNIKNKDWNLSIGVGNADVERLLSESWQEILTGEFSGNLKMNGKRRVIHSADGQFSLRKGRFRALSFVMRYIGSSDRADLALRIPGQQAATDYLEDTFKLIEISVADCDIRFPHTNKARNIKQAWLFDNINIRTKNDEVRVQGHVILEQDGKLHGSICIGINEKNIEEFLSLTTEPFRSIISAFIPRLFTAKGDEGFRWVNINLSGSSDEPRQDFSARVREITNVLNPGALLDSATGAVSEGLNMLQGSGDDAAPAPQTPEAETDKAPAPKGSKSLIETATDSAGDVLETGIKAIPFF